MKNLKPVLLIPVLLLCGNSLFAQTTSSSEATNNKDEDHAMVSHSDATGSSQIHSGSKVDSVSAGTSAVDNNKDFLNLELNSTATSLTVKLSYKSNSCTSIAVTNQSGGTVMESCIFDASSTILDVAKLKTGTYTLRAEGEKGIAMQTFKKQ